MDAPAQFRHYAADCETMSKVSRDPETKAVWKRMADRWHLCANLAEDVVSLKRSAQNPIGTLTLGRLGRLKFPTSGAHSPDLSGIAKRWT